MSPQEKKLSSQEIAGVLGADGPSRYAHFVKHVADWQQVWGLRAPDGWVSLSNESGTPMFPVWPHPEYASLLASDVWANTTPTAIDVHEWVAKWLPNLIEDGTQVAVFPTPQGKGVVVKPEMLRYDLESELLKLE